MAEIPGGFKSDDEIRDEANHLAYYRSEGLPVPQEQEHITHVISTQTPDEGDAASLLASLSKKLGFVPPHA